MNRLSLFLVLMCAGCASTSQQEEPFVQQLQKTAAAAYHIGDLHQAEGLWQQAVVANPGAYSNWCSLGQVRFRLHQYDASAVGYQRCLEGNSAQPLVWHNLAAVRLRQATEALLEGTIHFDDRPESERLKRDYQALLEHLLKLQRATVKP
ncbi:hypothetical protein [Pseudidiomarina aestuarii]|uniref:hypothetical protein n=1 Tax=Pseudidiomarina aestuarii TaxID=624146 RepID=UPI003A978BAF